MADTSREGAHRRPAPVPLTHLFSTHAQVDTRFQLRFQTELDAATFVGLLKSACPHLSRTPAQSNALLQQTVQADSKRVKEVAIADNQTSRSEDDTTPGRALPTTFAHRMGLGEPYLPFGQPLRHDNRTWQYPELHDRSTGHFIKDKQRGSPLDRELGRNGPREYSPNVTGPPYGLGTSPHEPTAFIHQANDRPAPAFAVFQDAFNSSQPGNAADDDTTQYNLTQTRIPDLQALPDSYHPSPIRLPYIGDDTQESAGAASGHRSPARLAAFDSQATVEEEWTVAAKAATKVIPDGSSPAIIALATAVLTADTLGPGGGAGKAGGPKRGSPRASSPGAYDGQQDNKRAKRSASGRSSDITGARNIIASAQPARLHQLLSMPDNELSEVLHQMMQQRGFVELVSMLGLMSTCDDIQKCPSTRPGASVSYGKRAREKRGRRRWGRCLLEYTPFRLACG